MNPEHQRIAAAEFEGWMLFKANTIDDLYSFQTVDYMGKYWERHYPGKDFDYSRCGIERLPDYAADLNAMARLRRKLDAQQQVKFSGHVHGLVTSRHYMHMNFDLIDASAALQLEAFLRTVNLWREE